MKTVLDKTTRDEIIMRIGSLSENAKAQWGKMTVYQMVQHCTLWEEMLAGKVPCKRAWIGRLIGSMVLKKVVQDDRPLGHNSPTSPELKTADSNGDLGAAITKWVSLLEAHPNAYSPDFIHPFFGKMTREQIGILAYKHIDHHLRQFNC